MNKIVFIGSGAIATAIGNVLAEKEKYKITLLSIEEDVIASINNKQINTKYFPNIKLEPSLKVSADKNILKNAEIIFLALPSSETVKYVQTNKDFINPNAILVNLAKGFGDGKRTIVECLEKYCQNKIATLKGPTFARDIIKEHHTGITLGSRDISVLDTFKNLFSDTHIILDYSEDIIGVELLSILKNIYAIAIGIVDAHFSSANLRFMILTNAFKEMKNLLLQFGGESETMFKYCGFGDFGLTALNDLSRNRTLGLLIGKGFFSQNISDKILLEGHIAVNVFCEEISKRNSITDYYIIKELYKVLNNSYDISKFLNNILGKSN
jgi:glycerol-3-phosphate dehydrogenase (NAD(P)+)